MLVGLLLSLLLLLFLSRSRLFIVTLSLLPFSFLFFFPSFPTNITGKNALATAQLRNLDADKIDQMKREVGLTETEQKVLDAEKYGTRTPPAFSQLESTLFGRYTYYDSSL